MICVGRDAQRFQIGQIILENKNRVEIGSVGKILVIEFDKLDIYLQGSEDRFRGHAARGSRRRGAYFMAFQLFYGLHIVTREEKDALVKKRGDEADFSARLRQRLGKIQVSQNIVVDDGQIGAAKLQKVASIVAPP